MGIAAVPAERDPVPQPFADLETSFFSFQFKLTRDWSGLTLSQIFSSLYCSQKCILPAPLKTDQLNSFWAVRAARVHDPRSLQVQGLPAAVPPYHGWVA